MGRSILAVRLYYLDLISILDIALISYKASYNKTSLQSAQGCGEHQYVDQNHLPIIEVIDNTHDHDDKARNGQHSPVTEEPNQRSGYNEK